MAERSLFSRVLRNARQVPHPQRAIVTGGQSEAAVGGESKSVDAVVVLDEASHFIAAGDVPETNGFVVGARENAFAVARNRQTIDAERVPFEFARNLGRIEIPEPNDG